MHSGATDFFQARRPEWIIITGFAYPSRGKMKVRSFYSVRMWTPRINRSGNLLCFWNVTVNKKVHTLGGTDVFHLSPSFIRVYVKVSFFLSSFFSAPLLICKSASVGPIGAPDRGRDAPNDSFRSCADRCRWSVAGYIWRMKKSRRRHSCLPPSSVWAFSDWYFSPLAAPMQWLKKQARVFFVLGSNYFDWKLFIMYTQSNSFRSKKLQLVNRQ